MRPPATSLSYVGTIEHIALKLCAVAVPCPDQRKMLGLPDPVQWNARWSLWSTLILAACVLMPNTASAQGIFDPVSSKLCSAYQWGRSIIFTVAGLGILILAIFAFLGRFDFRRFFAICGGVFLASSAEQLVSFLGGASGSCSAGGGGMAWDPVTP